MVIKGGIKIYIQNNIFENEKKKRKKKRDSVTAVNLLDK